MQVVVQSVEQTLAQVHVANWIDLLRDLNTAGNLTVAVSPMVLNAFHVPLIHKHNNFFAVGVVNVSEQALVALIDHDLFDFREECIRRLNEPVHVRSIKTLLSEGGRANQSQFVLVRVSLLSPA